MNLAKQRLFMLMAGLGKAVDVFQQPVGVFIDCVGMKHVELHLADDLPPLREVGRENAVFMHQGDGQPDAARVAQQRHEQLTALG